MPHVSGPRRPPAKVLPPDALGLRALASLITGVVVICALYFGRAVLIPIILAILLSFLLAPFVDMLRRVRFGQVPSVIVAVVIALTVLTGVGALIGAQVEVAQLADDLPKYQVAIERKIDTVQTLTVGRADQFLGCVSNALKRLSPAREQEQRKDEGNQSSSPIDQPMPVEVHEPLPSPLELAQRFLSPVISPLETTGIVLVVAIFILLQREDLRDRLIACSARAICIAPPRRWTKPRAACRAISSRNWASTSAWASSFRSGSRSSACRARCCSAW